MLTQGIDSSWRRSIPDSKPTRPVDEAEAPFLSHDTCGASCTQVAKIIVQVATGDIARVGSYGRPASPVAPDRRTGGGIFSHGSLARPFRS